MAYFHTIETAGLNRIRYVNTSTLCVDDRYCWSRYIRRPVSTLMDTTLNKLSEWEHDKSLISVTTMTYFLRDCSQTYADMLDLKFSQRWLWRVRSSAFLREPDVSEKHNIIHLQVWTLSKARSWAFRLILPVFFMDLLFNPEGGNMFLRNVDLSPKYTALQPSSADIFISFNHIVLA
jgi:hypothetical protein